jgi:hypothetical protein
MALTLLAMEAFEHIFDVEKLDEHLQFFGSLDRSKIPEPTGIASTCFSVSEGVDIALAAVVFFYMHHPEYAEPVILNNAMSFGKHVVAEAQVLKAQHPTLCARAIVDTFDMLLLAA